MENAINVETHKPVTLIKILRLLTTMFLGTPDLFFFFGGTVDNEKLKMVENW